MSSISWCSKQPVKQKRKVLNLGLLCQLGMNTAKQAPTMKLRPIQMVETGKVSMLCLKQASADMAGSLYFHVAITA